MIYQNLYKAYSDGNDITARKNMLEASYLGGCAFTVSYVGYCHAVAHTLGGMYNVPHGLANAILIPYVLEAYGDKIYKKLKELAIAAKLCNECLDEKSASEIFIKSIKELNSKMNIGDKIPELKKEDISYLAKLADKEANPIYPVPVLMDNAELEKFYYNVLVD